MFSVLFAFVLGTAQAQESSCSIEPGSVVASMTTVSIGSQTFSVQGGAARAMFENNLRACGMTLAAQDFRHWRTARRGVNISAAIGATLFWPLLIATPIDAALAGSSKSKMVAHIAARQ